MTVYEQRYFDIVINQLPKICKALEDISANLEKINKTLEVLDGNTDNET